MMRPTDRQTGDWWLVICSNKNKHQGELILKVRLYSCRGCVWLIVNVICVLVFSLTGTSVVSLTSHSHTVSSSYGGSQVSPISSKIVVCFRKIINLFLISFLHLILIICQDIKKVIGCIFVIFFWFFVSPYCLDPSAKVDDRWVA